MTSHRSPVLARVHHAGSMNKKLHALADLLIAAEADRDYWKREAQRLGALLAARSCTTVAARP